MGGFGDILGTKSERIREFADFLRTQGYVPEIDDDGDIVFHYEGGTYGVLMEERDENYMSIIYPNFWSIESVEERARVERAALVATKETKVAKVYPVRDNTWASVEIFFTSLEHPKAIFARSLRALRAAVGTFVEEMKK